MSLFKHFNYFLWYFAHFKVPMIGYVRPKIFCLDDEKLVIRIPLNRRTKNHLNSMYFGTLAVGADLAGGLHGFYHAKQEKKTISLAFKSFSAQFIRRPESDVYFECLEGLTIKQMIRASVSQQQRVNQPITISAYTDYPHASLKELVATFTLELSIKTVN